MSATNKTANYQLPIYIGSDRPSYLIDFNSAMYKIDAAIYEIYNLDTRGVSKKYVDDQINALNQKLDLLINTIENFITVGTSDDGITVTEYDSLKVNKL